MTDSIAADMYERRLRATHLKLSEALERLVKGIPTHPDLQRRRYRLTVSTLAREARVGRNAIYKNHRTMLDRLAKAKQQRMVPRTLASWEDKIEELRAANSDLQAENRLILTHNAALLKRAADAEARNTRLQQENARLIKQRDGKPVSLVGRTRP